MKNTSLEFKSRMIYPGTLLWKRIGHLLLIYAIGLNLFNDRVQELAIEKSREMAIETQDLSEPAAEWADQVQKYIIPFVQWVEEEIPGLIPMAEDYFQQELGDPFFHIPRSHTIDNGCQKVKDFNAKAVRYPDVIEPVAQVIETTSLLIWFPILVLGIPWLFLDLVFGKENNWVFMVLLAAAPVGAWLYHFLATGFEKLIENGTVVGW